MCLFLFVCFRFCFCFELDEASHRVFLYHVESPWNSNSAFQIDESETFSLSKSLIKTLNSIFQAHLEEVQFYNFFGQDLDIIS